MLRKISLDAWIAATMGIDACELTREQIYAWQLTRLNETIEWARTHCAFYARHLTGIPASPLTCLEDLRNIPFSTSRDLRENAPQFMCVSQDDISRVVTLESSGTSGDPKRIFFTPEDQERTIDFFHVGMANLVGRGDGVLIALPGKREGSVGDLLAIALHRLGARPILCGLIFDPAVVVATIKREQAACIVGLPVQILSVIRAQGTRLGSPSGKLTRVLLCSDHVPDSIVREIQTSWNCEVFEHYGMTEMGFGGGVDCDAHCGYHLREADLFFEVVDVKTGRPVLPGRPGEVVFTTLTRRAMPFIRYRTGDISRLLPEPCPCGSILQRLDRVRRRKEGQVTLGASNMLTIAMLDEALFSLPELKDFTATVVQGNPAMLEVSAVGTGGSTTFVQSVQGVLHRVPVIRAAIQSGHLKVVVHVTDEPVRASTAKRKIWEQVA